MMSVSIPQLPIRQKQEVARTTGQVAQPVTMDTRPQCGVVLSDSVDTGYDLVIRPSAAVWRLACGIAKCPVRRYPGWRP